MENFPPNFVEDFLKLHNKYRAIHNSPPLKIDDELNELAQEWAERLARKGILQFKSDPKFGENIYISPWRNLPYDIKAKDPLESWYREGDYYKYGDDDAKGLNGVGNFTQLVWKNTQSIGLGIAIAINGAFYFVCFYYPCGNIVGQFKENVLPPIKEEKELTPEEAEFIQKIKSKINVVRSMERLYAVPSEQLRVWLVWLSKVGDMADEWHKWLRSHIDFVLRLSIELRAAEEVLTLEQEKEEETEKKEIQVETKVETKEIETNTKEDSKEETKENEKVEEKNNTESGNTNNTGPGNSNNSGPGNSNNSGPGNSNNPGPENSNNSGPGNSNNPGLENSNNPGPENSNNPGPENSNNPGPENSNNPGPGNPNDEENDDEKTEEKRDETETPTEESDKPNEELITEEEKNPEEGEKEEEERRKEEEEGEAETVVTEIVEKEEGAGEEEEEVKPSIVITEEEEEDEGQIIKEWPVGIPWEHLGIEEEEEKLFDDRLPIPKNEVEMKDFLRKFTHEATIHRSFFKHWKETADQAVKEIGNRLVMATFLVQGKDQTGEVKKPPPKKILKKVKPPVQKKGKKKKVASPARKTNDELEDDSKLEMTNKRELEIRKMLEIDANDFVKDCARGLEPLPYFFYLKVEPDIDIAIEHDDEKVILADTERENITGDYQRLYFNLSDKPCKGGKPWML